MGIVNFQFYLDNPIGGWIPYRSEAEFFFLKVERRICKSIYVGISYICQCDHHNGDTSHYGHSYASGHRI